MNTMNMGIKNGKAEVSPPAPFPKVAPTTGGVTAPGVFDQKNTRLDDLKPWQRWALVTAWILCVIGMVATYFTVLK